MFVGLFFDEVWSSSCPSSIIQDSDSTLGSCQVGFSELANTLTDQSTRKSIGAIGLG